MIKANDKNIKTWLEVSEDSDFPIQNIPFGIAKSNDEVFVATRIGDTVVNLYKAARLGHFSVEKEVFASCRLNDFMLLGKQATRDVRNEISDIFNIENEVAKNNLDLQAALLNINEVEMLLPSNIK
ncbi:MAG: fumarylacetoacetase, partial [Vicingaceae bacterium]|nr:fumarylacetoacetase [Vicingaceae bacterium]